MFYFTTDVDKNLVLMLQKSENSKKDVNWSKTTFGFDDEKKFS